MAQEAPLTRGNWPEGWSFIEDSLSRVQAWVEQRGYKGYEPFDGLGSRVRPLTLGNLLGDRLLLQLIRQAPFNLRPLLGVRPEESTKGRAYMASGYLKLFKLTGDQAYVSKAESCLSWLKANKAPGYSHYSWGNHYDFATRVGRIPRLEPIIPWSSLVGQCFLDAFETLQRREYLDVAVSVCRWVLALPRTATSSGACLAYTAHNKTTVHAASMLGAALLARTGSLAADQSFIQVAKEAMNYTCTRQNADGSWYYAEEDNCKWIDSFHTGYNLDSLKCYLDATGDATYQESFRLGLRFFKDNFFEADGRPKYYHDKVYPVDIQCASQAIDTLTSCTECDPECLPLATRVAAWTIENMQDPRGYFYYRQLPFMTVRTPMLHWGQATMYKALSQLLSRLSAQPTPTHSKH